MWQWGWSRAGASSSTPVCWRPTISRYHGRAPNELDWTDKQRQTRAVAEYLAALDEGGERDPNRKEPKVISPSDPSSAWTVKANKRVQFGYGLNYLITP
jgi:hypothetical protein